MKGCKSDIAAFSLLEVLAAIFLFAIMTLGITSTLRETNRLTEKLRVRQTSVGSAQLALERLQRDLSMAYNERIQNSPSYFKGSEVSAGPELSFTALDSPLRPIVDRRSPGVIVVYYRLEKNEDGTLRLLRSEASSLNFEDLKNLPGQLVASGILEMKTEYYDPRNDKWDREWDSKGQTTAGYFPRAVRIELTTIDPAAPKESWKDRSLKFETKVMVLNEWEDK